MYEQAIPSSLLLAVTDRLITVFIDFYHLRLKNPSVGHAEPKTQVMDGNIQC
jgi:hypothetical protein